MKRVKLLLLLSLFPLLLEAVTQNERYWEEETLKNIPKGLGLHTDLAYGSYLIEVHSSEMDSAIDYDVLEATLGVSYVYDKWLLGTSVKFVVDEVQSNMYVVTTQAPLNNHAKINKNEFALYMHYLFIENEKESWHLNTIYRYASLDASDAYHSFFDYVSSFQYQTDGLAVSLLYQRNIVDKGMLFLNTGLLYSKAKVLMSTSVDGQLQDSFIDDSTNALGIKFSMGYKYDYSKNLSLHLRTDAWKQKFDSLNVLSRVGDTLPSATLKEESYNTYFGVAWRF